MAILKNTLLRFVPRYALFISAKLLPKVANQGYSRNVVRNFKPGHELDTFLYWMLVSNHSIMDIKNHIKTKKTLIICESYHHKNTEKIANVIAKVLDAKVASPQETDSDELKKYDLLGFGAGIDSGKHYKEILDFADTSPQVTNKKAFVFSTSGITGAKKLTKDHSALREKLQSKGYNIIDEFQCKGFNTNSFLKFFGGMNKGRPNAEDLKHAEEFAKNLQL